MGKSAYQEKVWAIREWPVPELVLELHSFLRLANYYQEIIEDYSKKVVPLTDLTKKGHKWYWSKKAQATFDGLKSAMMEELVLHLPDYTKPTEVQMNVSDLAIGRVLIQEGYPISYERHLMRRNNAILFKRRR